MPPLLACACWVVLKGPVHCPGKVLLGPESNHFYGVGPANNEVKLSYLHEVSSSSINYLLNSLARLEDVSRTFPSVLHWSMQVLSPRHTAGVDSPSTTL